MVLSSGSMRLDQEGEIPPVGALLEWIGGLASASLDALVFLGGEEFQPHSFCSKEVPALLNYFSHGCISS